MAEEDGGKKEKVRADAADLKTKKPADQVTDEEEVEPSGLAENKSAKTPLQKKMDEALSAEKDNDISADPLRAGDLKKEPADIAAPAASGPKRRQRPAAKAETAAKARERSAFAEETNSPSVNPEQDRERAEQAQKSEDQSKNTSDIDSDLQAGANDSNRGQATGDDAASGQNDRASERDGGKPAMVLDAVDAGRKRRLEQVSPDRASVRRRADRDSLEHEKQNQSDAHASEARAEADQEKEKINDRIQEAIRNQERAGAQRKERRRADRISDAVAADKSSGWADIDEASERQQSSGAETREARSRKKRARGQAERDRSADQRMTDDQNELRDVMVDSERSRRQRSAHKRRSEAGKEKRRRGDASASGRRATAESGAIAGEVAAKTPDSNLPKGRKSKRNPNDKNGQTKPGQRNKKITGLDQKPDQLFGPKIKRGRSKDYDMMEVERQLAHKTRDVLRGGQQRPNATGRRTVNKIVPKNFRTGRPEQIKYRSITLMLGLNHCLEMAKRGDDIHEELNNLIYLLAEELYCDDCFLVTGAGPTGSRILLSAYPTEDTILPEGYLDESGAEVLKLDNGLLLIVNKAEDLSKRDNKIIREFLHYLNIFQDYWPRKRRRTA